MATMQAGHRGPGCAHHQPRRRGAEMATLSWKDLIERGYLVAGSPETVVDRINDMADKLNVGHLMMLLHFGNMSKDVTCTTRAFCREVIPRLRARFNEWEDNWFPRECHCRRLPLHRPVLRRSHDRWHEEFNEQRNRQPAERTPLAGVFRRRRTQCPLAAWIARRRSGRSNARGAADFATESRRRSRPASTISTSCRGSTISMSWRSTTTI